VLPNDVCFLFAAAIVIYEPEWLLIPFLVFTERTKPQKVIIILMWRVLNNIARDNTRFRGHDHLRALEKSVPARVRRKCVFSLLLHKQITHT
jgi:hypothetical protein